MWRQTPSDEDTHGNSRTATASAMSRPVEWWMNSGNVAALLRWLYANGEIAWELDAVSYFVANPWKWNDEWQAMQSQKQPV
jgi:hypothetical protein